MACSTVEILEKQELTPDVFTLSVPCGDGIKAGQFYMLRSPAAATLLPRAISVCDVEGDTLLFACQRVGRGTGELAALKAGDPLTITGPLGNGFPLEELAGKVALVGGGIGVAPMVNTARRLGELGIYTEAFVGFRDKAFLTDKLEPLVKGLHIATESGAIGHRGYVTDLLKPEEWDTVLCCGPEPMMRACVDKCAASGTPIYISMENKMACGLGACLVCTCTHKNGENRRTCTEGPVFRGEEIDFDA